MLNKLFVEPYNNSTYKNSYSCNRMLIKVNRNEKVKQKIEDKNNKNAKNRKRFVKHTIFSISKEL